MKILQKIAMIVMIDESKATDYVLITTWIRKYLKHYRHSDTLNHEI
jgi:hypothetical protein